MILSIADIPNDIIEEVKSKTGENIIVCDYNTKHYEAVKMVSEAEILITWGSPVNKGLFNEIEDFKLKWLFSLSVGVDKLPFERLREHNTIVSNIKDILNPNMAEHTLGVMIAFSRQLKYSFYNQQNKIWNPSPQLSELTKKTLCIVGTGSIGSEISKRAKVFEMNIIGVNQTGKYVQGFDKVFSINNIDMALSQADYIVVIVPLTSKTYHLIGEKEFGLMKNTAVFINISRGDVIDEAALIKALNSNKIAGAGLDVFSEEPLIKDSVLWDMQNVIITPHCAGSSDMVLKRAMTLFAESLILYRKGKSVPNIIDLQRGY